jgi:hypothetical protein
VTKGELASSLKA